MLEGTWNRKKEENKWNDLAKVIIAVLKIMNKSSLRKVFILLILPNNSPSLIELRTETQTGHKPRSKTACRNHGRVLLTG